MNPDLMFMSGMTRRDELLREADRDRLIAELETYRPWVRAAVAERLRALADWLEPRRGYTAPHGQWRHRPVSS